jgi:hypothetical protein
VLRTYKQHRDVNFEVQEEYRNQQLTAEASDDPAVQAHWRDEDEPHLRAEVERVEDEWRALGHKADVEAAQQVEQACASRAASVTWNDWQRSFIDDLDVVTDTSNLRFAITGYSPTDVFDLDNWPRFTLTSAEMSRLAKQAPPELQMILGSDSDSSDVESLSFEYRSVALTRPWFRSALFKSRFWRLPPGAEHLSDGSDPSQGRCPAYISALVFARNVNVRFRELPIKPPVGAAERGHILQLNPASLNSRAVQRIKQESARRRDHRRTALMSVISRPSVFSAERIGMRLQSLSFAGAKPLRPSRPPSADRQATTQPTPAPTQEVMLLAFICKHVPQCPDPDSSLSWP